MKDVSNKKLSNMYIESAIVQKEIIYRLMQRLSLINISPQKIIDIGSGIGLGTEKIIQKYANSECYMLDNSLESLKENFVKSSTLKKVCANFKKIPFPNSTFDFVFSSSALHWDLNIQESFQEIYRVLKPGGLFLFATYGPDTLIELRSSWSRVDTCKHVNDFYDMHDIGDLMQNINFNDSVVDVESIIIEYKSVLQLQKDLKNIGSKVISSKEKKLGLFSSSKMKQMYSEYEKFRSKEGVLPATYEVIYGSAWKKFNTLKVVD